MFYDWIDYSVRKNAGKIDVDFRRTGTLSTNSDLNIFILCWLSRKRIIFSYFFIQKYLFFKLY